MERLLASLWGQCTPQAGGAWRGGSAPGPGQDRRVPRPGHRDTAVQGDPAGRDPGDKTPSSPPPKYCSQPPEAREREAVDGAYVTLLTGHRDGGTWGRPAPASHTHPCTEERGPGAGDLSGQARDTA